MATTTNLLSWEAFEQLPDDGMHHEIIEGAPITLPPPKSRHSNIASNTFKTLLWLEERRLGRVYAETGYKLSENPATWIQPDVSFLRNERVRATLPDGYFEGAPDLAIEVISPSESAPDVDRKVELMLAAGSQAVWVVYPRTSKVRVHLPDGTSYSRGVNDQLEFLGRSIPVASLFEN
jgi:Uma2 family endonuclease